jgi:ribosomal protein L12E/L44/L45/RPP1/RPP2
VLGSVGTGSAGAAPVASAPQETKKEAEKPAETKKEKEEEDDALAGGIGFGDDDEW